MFLGDSEILMVVAYSTVVEIADVEVSCYYCILDRLLTSAGIWARLARLRILRLPFHDDLPIFVHPSRSRWV